MDGSQVYRGLREGAGSHAEFLELQREGHADHDDVPIETADGRRIATELVSNVYAVNRRNVVQCNIRDAAERKNAEVEREELQAQLRQAQTMEAVGRLAGGAAHDFSGMLQVTDSCAEVMLRRLESSDPLRAHIQQIARAGQRIAPTGCLPSLARRRLRRCRRTETHGISHGGGCCPSQWDAHGPTGRSSGPDHCCDRDGV